MEQQIGRYQILEEIASGAQGTVYRAYDPEGGQIIALKVLHPSLARDRTYTERFRREASLAASIDHPNVVKIFDVGQEADRHFMALEFLPESLGGILKGVGQLRIEGATQYGLQIADGLTAAHALGIVHRDVKPQNVLIGPDGTAKVTDFGIARAESLATMTATGVPMGTPHYMSPEQSRGERADARSDVYSLGCLVYEMLAGQVPFSADTPLAVLLQHVNEEPRRLSELRRDLSGGLQALVERSMAKDPEMRYQSMGEMAAAMRNAVPSPGRSATPQQQEPTPPPLADRPRRRPPLQPRPAKLTERAPLRPRSSWTSGLANRWRQSRRRRWALSGILISIASILIVAGVRLGAFDQVTDRPKEPFGEAAVTKQPALPSDVATIVPQPSAASQSPSPESEQPEIVVALASTDLAVGDNRVTFGLIHPVQGAIKDAAVQVQTFLMTDAGPQGPRQTADADFREWPGGFGGIYEAKLGFDQAGDWVLGVSLIQPDEEIVKIGVVVQVSQQSQTPSVGSPAPPSVNKTARDVSSLDELTTDTAPDPDLYAMTIAEALEEDTPVLVTFATPAYCTSATCGPQVDVLKELKETHGGQMNFIHVEVYDNPPEIRKEGIGVARISPTLAEWGLTSEPWTFVMDRQGVVRAKFEGFVGAAQLEEAIGELVR